MFMGYYKDRIGKQKSIGYFATQEAAAHAYNAAVTKHGLQSIRKLNKADAAGRLMPKP